jgi:hypothetical protein
MVWTREMQQKPNEPVERHQPSCKPLPSQQERITTVGREQNMSRPKDWAARRKQAQRSGSKGSLRRGRRRGTSLWRSGIGRTSLCRGSRDQANPKTRRQERRYQAGRKPDEIKRVQIRYRQGRCCCLCDDGVANAFWRLASGSS